MWCEKILRNAANEDPAQWAGRDVDVVEIAWDECRPVLKKRSRGGEEVRLLLPVNQTLRHGDVLWEDDRRVLMIEVTPCEVIVVRPASSREAAAIALELGNLHVPTQITETEIIFIEEKSAAEVLEKWKATFAREKRRFAPTPVIAMPGVRAAGNFKVIRGNGQARAADEPSRSVASNA
ncbi:MAG: urease accessory protein UreE [Phycisphaerales bacterium]|nr:urease accessory protein UreE [Phycisphaerales bacterium]